MNSPERTTTDKTTSEEVQTLDLGAGGPVLTYVRTVVLAHNPSGALFQRPAEHVPTPHLHKVEHPTG